MRVDGDYNLVKFVKIILISALHCFLIFCMLAFFAYAFWPYTDDAVLVGRFMNGLAILVYYLHLFFTRKGERNSLFSYL